MNKWLYISLFIGVLLFKPISQFSWEVWYLANYEYVSEELCENTEQPELECNGKCYLSQQLQATEAEQNSSEDQSPIKPLQVKDEQPYICDMKTCCDFGFVAQDQTGNFPSLKDKTRKFHKDIFHPPQA